MHKKVLATDASGQRLSGPLRLSWPAMAPRRPLTERAAPPATAPHSTPKTAKGVLGQQRIKDAARRIFREFGYTNARVTDIAEIRGLLKRRVLPLLHR